MALMNFSNDFDGGVNIKNLEIGCVFLYENTYYMKICLDDDTENNHAINLMDGTYRYFPIVEELFPVKCTLHIEKVGVV